MYKGEKFALYTTLWILSSMKHNKDIEIDSGLLDTSNEDVPEEVILDYLAQIIATMYLKEIGVIASEDTARVAEKTHTEDR